MALEADEILYDTNLDLYRMVEEYALKVPRPEYAPVGAFAFHHANYSGPDTRSLIATQTYGLRVNIKSGDNSAKLVFIDVFPDIPSRIVRLQLPLEDGMPSRTEKVERKVDMLLKEKEGRALIEDMTAIMSLGPPADNQQTAH